MPDSYLTWIGERVTVCDLANREGVILRLGDLCESLKVHTHNGKSLMNSTDYQWGGALKSSQYKQNIRKCRVCCPTRPSCLTDRGRMRTLILRRLVPRIRTNDYPASQLSLLLLLRSALHWEGRSGDGLSRADQLALANKFP